MVPAHPLWGLPPPLFVFGSACCCSPHVLNRSIDGHVLVPVPADVWMGTIKGYAPELVDCTVLACKEAADFDEAGIRYDHGASVMSIKRFDMGLVRRQLDTAIHSTRPSYLTALVAKISCKD